MRICEERVANCPEMLLRWGRRIGCDVQVDGNHNVLDWEVDQTRKWISKNAPKIIIEI